MRLSPIVVACSLLSTAAGCASSTPPTDSNGEGAGGSAASGGGGETMGGASGAASGGGGLAMAGGSSGAAAGGGGTGGGGAGGQTMGGANVGGSGAGAGGTGGGSDDIPEGYRLVYSQTFAAPASMADLVFANPAQWQHAASGYIASTGASYMPPFRSPSSVAIIKSIKVASFVMDVEMLQTSPDGDGHRDMVLIWGLESPSRFYYAHVSTAHDAVAHNIHIVNEADRKAISTSYTAGYDWGREVWKRLRVVRDVQSGAMTVLDLAVPDPPLLTATDETFVEGYVGFGSFDNSGRVRNVKVWAAASTPGEPAFFSPAP